MKLIKDAFRVFYRSKIMISTVVATFIFSGLFGLKYYGIDGIGMVAAQLQQVLKVSQYLFIVMIFASYEYIKKIRFGGIEEITETSYLGRQGRHLMAAYFILTIWAVALTVFLSGCGIFLYSYYRISDPAGEYIIHIVKNMLVNIFLIMELGALIGFCLSPLRNRIVSYAFMVLVTYLVSPYPERMADQISISTDGRTPVYQFVEVFNILPLVNTNYTPNYSYGESLLWYRIALILFWCAAVIFCICITKRCLRKWAVLSALVSCLCISVYYMPSSKVIMNGNPENTLAHDQYYYMVKGNVKRTEVANYNISAYKMELSVGLQMKADVTMEVDKSLPQYQMTLYHGYKVESAWTGSGEKLDVSQEGDYVIITNTTNLEIEQIRLVYAGCSPAYYSNEQGIFLPGYFAYYPRAGFMPLFDDATWDISECFVNESTKFKVRIDTNQKLYTNLKKKGEWYTGKCDGFTVVSGFYTEQKLSNGNRIVYPYLYGIDAVDEEHTGDEALKAYYIMIEESLNAMEKKNTIVFCVPNVNQQVNQHNGKNQIITRSIAI